MKKSAWARRTSSVLAWTAVAALTALVWYQVNTQAKLDAFLTPNVSDSLEITPGVPTSPYRIAIGVLLLEVVLLVALRLIASLVRTTPVVVDWRNALPGAGIIWLAIALQQLSVRVGGPLSSPGLLFVTGGSEFLAASLVVLAPPLVAVVAFRE